MVFNSIEYIIFLPAVFLLYWFVFNRNCRLQNLFLVIASYIFYGWWDWRFLFLISFISFCSWGSGILIQKNQNNFKKAKAISAANIVLDLSILGIFKYYDFFADSFANIFLSGKTDGLLLNIILPVGISFYTFKALSYSIDVYRGKIEASNDWIEIFAYISFFPQLVAGPIEKATDFLPQLQTKRHFEYGTAVDGCRQILWGLFKKIVIADNCARYVNQVYNTCQDQTGSTLLFASIMFAFQIYGDFSGYSDIAIGTSKLFGIKLKRNFDFPYFSRDIAEFWRRWHISLTSWFKEYIYIPLGGSRCSKAKIIRNTFIIFLISGLWHGANWTYVSWGAYHAVLFLPLILLGKNRRFRDIVAKDAVLPSIREIIQILVTFILVTFGWILFRSDSLSQANEICRTIFSESIFSTADVSGVTGFCVAIMLMIFVEWIQREKNHGLEISNIDKKYIRYIIYLSLVFCIFALGGHSENFIYAQF